MTKCNFLRNIQTFYSRSIIEILDFPLYWSFLSKVFPRQRLNDGSLIFAMASKNSRTGLVKQALGCRATVSNGTEHPKTSMVKLEPTPISKVFWNKNLEKTHDQFYIVLFSEVFCGTRRSYLENSRKGSKKLMPKGGGLRIPGNLLDINHSL